MNEERALAEALKYPSPIWDTIDQTHECYNNNLKHLLQNAGPNDAIFVASHNLETVEIAKTIISERNIKDKRVRFGQLKAFSD